MTNIKETVALNSIYASGAMTVAKFTVGLLTGSLGLLSEGLHSLLDLGATIMTYMAVRISDKPADDKHHYGHGKIESVTALAETGLLFLTSIWVAYEAIHRLIAKDTSVEVTWWAIAVIVASIIIDFYRARALTKVAKETKSQALEADALHFSSDILSSSVVLIGLIFVYLGWPQGDSIASLGVALFVCKAGWELGKRTIETLIDAAPEGIRDRIESIVSQVPSVIRTNRLRARPAGSVLFIELDISVSRTLSHERVSQTKDMILELIKSDMPEAEVTLSISAIALDNETIHEKVNIIARNMHLPVHHITIHQIDKVIAVGLDLEVDGKKSLEEAHNIATGLESAIRKEIGEDIEVETHIEPLQNKKLNGSDVNQDEYETVAKIIADSVKLFPIIQNIHDIRIRWTEFGLIIIFHCIIDKSISVETAHVAIDGLERHIREHCPPAYRVIGHAEPQTH